MCVKASLEAFFEYQSKVDCSLGEICARPLSDYQLIRDALVDQKGHGDSSYVMDDLKSWLMITAFVTDHKGNGNGSKMLKLLCETCDHFGVTLFLNAHAYGSGLPQNELIAFYERYGFARMDALDSLLKSPMARIPIELGGLTSPGEAYNRAPSVLSRQ